MYKNDTFNRFYAGIIVIFMILYLFISLSTFICYVVIDNNCMCKYVKNC